MFHFMFRFVFHFMFHFMLHFIVHFIFHLTNSIFVMFSYCYSFILLVVSHRISRDSIILHRLINTLLVLKHHENMIAKRCKLRKEYKELRGRIQRCHINRMFRRIIIMSQVSREARDLSCRRSLITNHTTIWYVCFCVLFHLGQLHDNLAASHTLIHEKIYNAYTVATAPISTHITKFIHKINSKI